MLSVGRKRNRAYGVKFARVIEDYTGNCIFRFPEYIIIILKQ